MSTTWMTGRPLVVALPVGLALVAACLTAAPTKEAALHDTSLILRQPPLVCRVVPVGEAEQRALLEQVTGFERQPWLLTPRILRNPLRADAIKVVVENRSGRDFGIYAGDEKHPFWVNVRIEDAAGKPVLFPHAGQRGIKRLSPIIEGKPITPVMTLRPGQLVVQRASIWGYLNIDDVPGPGRYTVRVDCSYYRAPDGQDCRVEAMPLRITLTAEDIREWRALQDAFENPPGVEEEVAPQSLIPPGRAREH
jgi:hypothetical protein